MAVIGVLAVVFGIFLVMFFVYNGTVLAFKLMYKFLQWIDPFEIRPGWRSKR